MPTNFYDTIVVGDELTGLIAAALCARRGLRVLVTETAQTPVDKYTLGPYTLPRAPDAVALEGSPAFRRVIGELNFVQTIKRRLTSHKPAFQILLPDARIDVPAEPEALARELDRELPGQKDAIEAFLARATAVSKVIDPVLGQDIALPPDGFWEKRELRYSDAKLPLDEDDPFPGLPAGHAARAFLSLPGALTLSTDPRTASPAALARAFDVWRRSAARLEGGRDALRQMLLEKLKTQHAGEVRQIVPSGIATRWSKVTGVEVRGKDELLGAATLLAACPVAELGNLFGDKPPKRLTQVAQAIRPTAYRYVLHVVLAEAGVPAGIAPVAFCVVDPGKPLIGDNAFALYTSPPDDEARVLVTMVANAPAPEDGQTVDDVLAALRPRLRARLEDVMPFSSEHVLLVHSPNQARPPEGLEVEVLPPVVPPEPLWSSTLDAALGVGAAPYDVGLKNLVTASTQNLPGLGLEGEFAAGWCAARAVCLAAGKKKDYLKDEVLLGT